LFSLSIPGHDGFALPHTPAMMCYFATGPKATEPIPCGLKPLKLWVSL
jgi:hypothetical protein